MSMKTQVTSLGRHPEHNSGSVNPPVHHTSTLIFSNFRQMRDYEQGKGALHHGYGRHGNATVDALCEAITQLEGADRSFITSSGLSATILAIQSCVGAGDHLLVTDSIYGSTRKYVMKELMRYGVDVTFYDPLMGADIERLFKSNTKAIYVESPGSLTFEVQDIPAIAKVAHARGILIIADNTWATPVFLQPFDLGIDLSIQSITKYIAGHSDLVMGSVSCKNQHAKQVEDVFLHTGVCAGADNVYLALRGLRSLVVRLKEHERSALKIAQRLESHSKVKRVLYPALPSDPGHALWKRDMTGAASLFAFELHHANEAAIEAFINRLHHFGIGYSWGGYESLAIAYQPAAQRVATSWDKDCWLIRLAIGLEDADELITDLENALSATPA